MLLSESHKFIFIHIPKVAGNSIEEIFREYSYKNTNSKGKEFDQHIWAVRLRKELSADSYNRYFKFAFVRNPWDRWVSLYFYILQHPDNQFYESTKSYKDFNEFVKNEVDKIWRPQQNKFITDGDGKIIVDFIGKYETLAGDIKKICEILNLAQSSLPHKNSSSHKSYRLYYNEETKKLVEDHSRDDIRLFGYTFDDPGGR